MLSEVMHHVPVLPAQMDRFKTVLNTPGGVIDLRSGGISPHDPMTYLTKMTAVEFSESIKTLSDTFRKLWDIP